MSNVDDTNANEMGSLAQLRRTLATAPDTHVRTIREIAQKECEADLKANDALLMRGTQLMAASGVALSLLVSLSKENVVNSPARRVFLCIALVAAAIALILVVLSMRVRGAYTKMQNRTIVGEHLAGSEKEHWGRDYEASMALAYMDIRHELAMRHARRANLLLGSQWFYLVFLVAVVVLGMTIAA